MSLRMKRCGLFAVNPFSTTGMKSSATLAVGFLALASVPEDGAKVPTSTKSLKAKETCASTYVPSSTTKSSEGTK